MLNIHSSWNNFFTENKCDFINELYLESNIYPPKDLVFKVFEMDINDIKIVLLGQDPYHQPNQAHGLSFSVPTTEKIPPSLLNIYKEINNNFPERNYKFNHGNLTKWFEREKIFLLNAALTVKQSCPNSHAEHWQTFTNNVIRYIGKKNKNCVYVLLGKFAQSKAEYIKDKTRIIAEPHPSPLAKGFIGSNVFKQIEKIIGVVDWNID